MAFYELTGWVNGGPNVALLLTRVQYQFQIYIYICVCECIII